MSDQTGKLSREALELNWACDVCKRDRAHGSHKRCSRIRQERYRAIRETESVQQANAEALHGSD